MWSGPSEEELLVYFETYSSLDVGMSAEASGFVYEPRDGGIHSGNCIGYSGEPMVSRVWRDGPRSYRFQINYPHELRALFCCGPEDEAVIDGCARRAP